jgi:hypothetical protein
MSPKRKKSTPDKRRGSGKKARRHSTRKAVKPATRKVTIHPWQKGWPIPDDVVAGDIGVITITRRKRVKTGKRVIRYRYKDFDYTYYYWLPTPPPKELWLPVAEYQNGIEGAKLFAGYDLTVREMSIYHTNVEVDYINNRTLFIWPKPEHPSKLRILDDEDPFRVVRIWFWVKRTKTGREKLEYQLWCRTAAFQFNKSFQGLRAQAQALYRHIIKDVPKLKGKSAEGFKVDGLVAWTGYIDGTKAPTKKLLEVHKLKKRIKLGGT